MKTKKIHVLFVLFLSLVGIKSADNSFFRYSFNLENHIRDVSFRTKKEYNRRSVVSQYLSTILEILDPDKNKQLQFLQKIKAQFGKKIYQEFVEKYKYESEVETESSGNSDSDTSQASTHTFVFYSEEGSNGIPADFANPEKIKDLECEMRRKKKDLKREVRRRTKDRSKSLADFLTVAEQNAIELFPDDQAVQSYYIQAQALFPKDELLQYYYAKYWAQETQDKTELFQELQKEGATKAQSDCFVKTINRELQNMS